MPTSFDFKEALFGDLHWGERAKVWHWYLCKLTIQCYHSVFQRNVGCAISSDRIFSWNKIFYQHKNMIKNIIILLHYLNTSNKIMLSPCSNISHPGSTWFCKKLFQYKRRFQPKLCIFVILAFNWFCNTALVCSLYSIVLCNKLLFFKEVFMQRFSWTLNCLKVFSMDENTQKKK